MVLIKRFVTCIYTYHETNSSLDHYSYKSQLIGGMLLHIQNLYFIEKQTFLIKFVAYQNNLILNGSTMWHLAKINLPFSKSQSLLHYNFSRVLLTSWRKCCNP
jgi:hypothetical protein